MSCLKRRRAPLTTFAQSTLGASYPDFTSRACAACLTVAPLSYHCEQYASAHGAPTSYLGVKGCLQLVFNQSVVNSRAATSLTRSDRNLAEGSTTRDSESCPTCRPQPVRPLGPCRLAEQHDWESCVGQHYSESCCGLHESDSWSCHPQ